MMFYRKSQTTFPPLGGFFDIEKIQKEIAFELSEIKRSEGMLNNPNFLAKAPKEKVETERAKLKLHQDNLQDLKEKLEKL